MQNGLIIIVARREAWLRSSYSNTTKKTSKKMIMLLKVMIQDFVISYISNGVKTTLTIEDEHYDNLPFKLADMFAKVIRESDANPQIVIENLKNAFEYEQ